MAGNNKQGDDDFDANFDFADMPQPGDAPPAPSTQMGGSDDFGGDDFGGDDFGGDQGSDLPAPGQTDWDDVGAVEEPPRRAVAARPEPDDDFAGFGSDEGRDVDFQVDETDIGGGDDFAIGDDDRPADTDDNEETDEPAGSGGSLVGRLALPAIIGGVLLVAGGFGYSVVLPILGINLFPGQEAPAFVSAPIDQPISPVSPGVTDLPLAQPISPTPALPSVGSTELPGPTPVLPGPATALPGPSIGNTPTLPSMATPSLPMATSTPVVETASTGEIDGLRETVTELREMIEAQDRRIAELEKRPEAPVVPQPVVMPPEKPEVVEDWVLKGVTNGVGWVEGPEGFLEVREGTVIPNVGKVTAVTRYESKWFVVTDTGLIGE